MAVAAAAAVLSGSPAAAEDRELQSILDKQACVAERIGRTELSSTVVAYEVTCRGSGRVLTIVCVDTDCRRQPRPRDDEEK
ncbi:MAG: hypothetical protein EPO67_11395 [Reyranella sp.]|nr:MAG: hypothetical protein EPO67_11395 [Reyranella sp.]